MIDKTRGRFLNFDSFGVRHRGLIYWVRYVGPLLGAVVGLLGCSPQPAPRLGSGEDSLTSGRISIVCAPAASPLLAQERAVFTGLYPRARIDVRTGSSGEAIRALFEANCDLAVTTRELDPDERRAAIVGRLEVEGYRFARDAMVLVVHPENPVENLALDQVRGVYSGTATRWSQVGGGDGPVTPVIQPLDSDMTEYFVESVMGEEPIRARVLYASSDSGVVAAVSRDPHALGFISLAGVAPGVKVVRLAPVLGLPYWKPDLEAIHRGQYPLTRFYLAYARSAGPRLANGFVTFITSREGQTVVRDQGLIPTQVPLRFVRRSPMLSTH